MFFYLASLVSLVLSIVLAANYCYIIIIRCDTGTAIYLEVILDIGPEKALREVDTVRVTIFIYFLENNVSSLVGCYKSRCSWQSLVSSHRWQNSKAYILEEIVEIPTGNVFAACAGYMCGVMVSLRGS
jgi:hypothetical protein